MFLSSEGKEKNTVYAKNSKTKLSVNKLYMLVFLGSDRLDYQLEIVICRPVLYTKQVSLFS